MPSGGGDGIVESTTFTPTAAGTLLVTCTYDCQGLAGDNWGASYVTQVFCSQGGTTTYGDALPMSTARGSQTARARFTVTAGTLVEVGIYGDISGAVSATWWNVHITAELLKA